MFARFCNEASLKVYSAGFVYTTIISTACYLVKSHDGISASGETRSKLLDTGNKTLVTQATTTVIYNIGTVGNIMGLENYTIHKKTSTMGAKQELEESIENIIEDGVFWSREVERLLPKGTSEEEYNTFLHAIDTRQVRVSENALTHKCTNTSPFNKYVELDNNMKMCARNRKHCWKCLEGEVLSFHIARILGLDNVPPVKMVLYKRNGYFWQNVKNNTDMNIWGEEEIITLSQWIEDLEEGIPLPKVILRCLQKNRTLTSRLLNGTTSVKIIDLVQMSDLFIFDFIVQHGDRILRNKLQNDRSPDWHNGHLYLQSPIKNLGIQKYTPQKIKFWLIDNELTNDAITNLIRTNLDFNEQMMKTMCIFRRGTIENIRRVLKDGNPCKTLYREIKKHDRVFWKLLHTHRKSIFIEELNHRLMGKMTTVLMWVSQCQLQMQS